jgi:hypothetical protein
MYTREQAHYTIRLLGQVGRVKLRGVGGGLKASPTEAPPVKDLLGLLASV